MGYRFLFLDDCMMTIELSRYYICMLNGTYIYVRVLADSVCRYHSKKYIINCQISYIFEDLAIYMDFWIKNLLYYYNMFGFCRQKSISFSTFSINIDLIFINITCIYKNITCVYINTSYIYRICKLVTNFLIWCLEFCYRIFFLSQR